MSAASAQPLLLQSATAQQRALRAGAVSAVQLCQMHLAAIERGNEQLNCYLSVDAEGALQAAAASDSRYRAGNPLGPLDGLCLGVKDNIAVAGMSLTAGMQCRRGEVAAEDAPVVAKLRAAGMVILGKLNMDEAALGTGGRNPHFGHCLNPWRRGHTPGGSSSGSGSACAAGLASITLGTDTMGSVRLPAALCGLYGLKPSNKTLSLEGVVPVSQDLDTIGILARSADDIALLWLALVDVPASTLPKRYRDLSWVEAAAQTALEPDVAPTAHDHTLDLRFGSALGESGPPKTTHLQPWQRRQYGEVWQAVAGVAQQIAAQQHRDLAAVEFRAEDATSTRRMGLVLSELGLLKAHAQFWQQRQQGDFSNFLAGMLEYAANLAPGREQEIMQQLPAVCQWLSAAWRFCDLVLMPTAPCTSFANSVDVPDNMADLTAPANLCGVAAISLPLGLSSERLPLAAQLVGKPGYELALIDWARRLGTDLSLQRQSADWLEWS